MGGTVKDAEQPAPLEPIWYLRSIPYSEYRQSNWLRQRRARYRSGHDSVCQRCGIASVSSRDKTVSLDKRPRFNVHHVSYENLGDEPDCDLELLCSACHNAEHYPESAAAIWWTTVCLPKVEKVRAAMGRQ